MQTLHDTDNHTKMVRYYAPSMATLHETYNLVEWSGIVDKYLTLWQELWLTRTLQNPAATSPHLAKNFLPENFI